MPFGMLENEMSFFLRLVHYFVILITVIAMKKKSVLMMQLCIPCWALIFMWEVYNAVDDTHSSNNWVLVESIADTLFAFVPGFIALLCWQFYALEKEHQDAVGIGEVLSKASPTILGAAFGFIKSSPIIPVTGVIIWLLTGTIVYKYANDWCWSNAFYFACQAGLSVGFGSLPERSEASRWYSCLHILTGASFVIGAISLFTESAIDQVETHKTRLQAERKILAEVAAGNITEEDARLQIILERQTDGGARNSAFVLIVWIIMGAMVALRTQGDSVDTAYGFEFAIAALSTGGLQGFSAQAGSTCSPHPQIPDGSAIFVGLYLLTGIPIFALCLGKFAHVLVADYVAQKKNASASDDRTPMDLLEERNLHPDPNPNPNPDWIMAGRCHLLR